MIEKKGNYLGKSTYENEAVKREGHISTLYFCKSNGKGDGHRHTIILTSEEEIFLSSPKSIHPSVV